MDEKSKALLAEISRGVQLSFSNAEQLFHEGEVLKKNGSLCRALTLHQISLEECGKIDILGAWAMSLLLFGKIDIPRMTRAIRSHTAKNYANAYFAEVKDEQELRKAGDLKGALDAFRHFQEQFHLESNDTKNASLYVDFKDGKFVAPSEVISEEMVAGIAVVNAYFLSLAGPKIRGLERVMEDGAFERTLKWLSKRFEEIRASKTDDPTQAFEALFKGMYERYLEEARAGGQVRSESGSSSDKGG